MGFSSYWVRRIGHVLSVLWGWYERWERGMWWSETRGGGESRFKVDGKGVMTGESMIGRE